MTDKIATLHSAHNGISTSYPYLWAARAARADYGDVLHYVGTLKYTDDDEFVGTEDTPLVGMQKAWVHYAHAVEMYRRNQLEMKP